MKKILLYGYGGAYNHGGEAIARTCIDNIRLLYPSCEIGLSTHFKKQDIEFGLEPDLFFERAENFNEIERNSEDITRYDLIYKDTIDYIDKDTLCLSIGGDNYCYSPWKRFSRINDIAICRGAKGVLFSCSLDVDYFSGEMKKAIANHTLITTRETSTYNLLKKENNNVRDCCDVAFLLKPKKTIIEFDTNKKNIGINVSPLVLRKNRNNNNLKENYLFLIEKILKNTDYNLILIPHVLCSVDNDYEPLQDFYRQYSEFEGRIFLVSKDYSATEYKYIISKCDAIVSARTHACIAAYSEKVPAIAVSYSMKSKGIAKDMEMEEYVFDINNISNKDNLYRLFEKLLDNLEIKKKLLANKIKETQEKAFRNFRELEQFLS